MSNIKTPNVSNTFSLPKSRHINGIYYDSYILENKLTSATNSNNYWKTLWSVVIPIFGFDTTCRAMNKSISISDAKSSNSARLLTGVIGVGTYSVVTWLIRKYYNDKINSDNKRFEMICEQLRSYDK